MRTRTTGASAGTRDPPATAGGEPGSGGGGEAGAGKDVPREGREGVPPGGRHLEAPPVLVSQRMPTARRPKAVRRIVEDVVDSRSAPL